MTAQGALLEIHHLNELGASLLDEVETVQVVADYAYKIAGALEMADWVASAMENVLPHHGKDMTLADPATISHNAAYLKDLLQQLGV